MGNAYRRYHSPRTPWNLLAFLGLLLILLAFTGYIRNIIYLTECDFQAPYKEEVIRSLGVVTPLGVILGYIEMDSPPDAVKIAPTLE